ncbi:MAG: hypothetical protein LBR88_02190 [Zoogloeaceae bacterium]|jgi:hypothetical protein|nr:hypothetical protein [Zoogloeaceae bacterium]
MHKKISRLLALLAAGLLSACVTINIYFPAAAAEKMADKLIDDIWQLDEPAKIQKDKESEVAP